MYLGIDLGTSEVKVILINERQDIVATAHAPLAIERPKPLWSEQHPADWWRATQAAIADIHRDYQEQLSEVRGIGLSGQMHGAVLLDVKDQVLRPAILWNDVRSGEECIELEQRIPALRQLTGNVAMPGFTAPKLLWVAKNEPEIFQKTAKVLLPKDYLRLLLTGEYVSDMSDASGTLWLDVEKRDWSDVMLSATGLSRTHMPALIEGSAPGGLLKPELASAWGIKARAVVAGGAGDNAASAIGMGVIEDGQGFISLGTSGVFFAATDTYRPNPAQGLHTFCHALPNQWHQMGVMLSAANCLRWVTQLTDSRNEAALLAEIEQISEPLGADTPLFLPYLSGERTPHNNPQAKGVWFGLSNGTDRGLLGYSVLEGVAFGLRESYLALQDASSSVRTASLVGGGSKSAYWAGLLSDVLNVRLNLHSSADVGAALGAARLGMMAANPGADIAAICSPPPVTHVIQPRPERHAALLPRFKKYRELYAALKPLFAA